MNFLLRELDRWMDGWRDGWIVGARLSIYLSIHAYPCGGMREGYNEELKKIHKFASARVGWLVEITSGEE